MLIKCQLFDQMYPIASVTLSSIVTVLHRAVNMSEFDFHAMQNSANAMLSMKQKSFERFIYREFTDVI